MKIAKTSEKTIFIIISRGFIVRNILRSGTLHHLKERGYRIVVFFVSFDRPIPQSLRDEFEDDQVIIIPVSEPTKNKVLRKIYRIFTKLAGLLVYTHSTQAYGKVGTITNLNRRKFWAHFERVVFTILSKISFLKTIVRFVELNIFTLGSYKHYFDKYNPSLVFSTSIISKIDIEFMKEASKRGITTVSMPKGWDNITKLLYRFVPDKLLVQNTLMKEDASREQCINTQKISVIGFPQFDWYRKKGFTLPRDEYILSLGLDPNRKVILFGSEGRMAPEGHSIVSYLVTIMDDSELGVPFSLIVRPHFTDINTKRYEKFKGIKHVYVDDNLTQSSFFWDGWDPSIEETRHLANALTHSEMLITCISTLMLDACCLNTPIISVGYGVLYDKYTNKDISQTLYQPNHIRQVMASGAVDSPMNEKELLHFIKIYLKNRDHKYRERQVLLKSLCYKVDGLSSKRAADELIKLLD